MNGEYNFIEDRTAGVCPCCGAGSHNGNQHDEDCLINVPIAAMSLWRKGFQDVKTGKVEQVAPGPSGIIYMSGVHCAKKKISAERTLQSLEQAVESARTLR